MSTTFTVGARVRVPFGADQVTGTIVEDRGFLGINGRRLVRVLIPIEPDEPISFEIPEEELELLPDLTENDKELDQADVIAYLKRGGLIAMLQASLGGVRDRPRAWLCLDQLGQMTHTFVEERGWLGGGTVPALANAGMRIFRPKRDQVLTFLRHFDIDQEQAESIVASVGLYPRLSNGHSDVGQDLGASE